MSSDSTSSHLDHARHINQKGGQHAISQIDVAVAVVDDSVTSISATVVPLKTTDLRGAKRVSAAQARAWVVQVTPAGQAAGDDKDRTFCVVIDARSGNVLDVWEGVAAPPTNRDTSTESSTAAARSAQATEHRLAVIRDANFVAGANGTSAIELYTRGDPFRFGDDDPGESTQERHLVPLVKEVGAVKNDVRLVPRHMCVGRGFCGRDGGFDGSVNVLSVTARAAAQTNPPQSGRGTHYDPRASACSSPHRKPEAATSSRTSSAT